MADKPDSQDICFVPNGRYSDVIARLRPDAVRPGDIVHLDGRVLGRHEGVVHYTVGQRRGLGIAAAEPLFVIRIDPDRARVLVGPRSALATTTVRIVDVNWLGDVGLESLGEVEVAARVRSTRPPRPARLSSNGAQGGARLEFLSPEDGISPGQACVFYESDAPRARVLGGGTIARSIDVPVPAAA
jgi:tRNA-specific 2-thiouridylase